MTDYERIKSFIEGAITGIDWLNHKGACKESAPSEYETGFRHALDAVTGYMDQIESDAIEGAINLRGDTN